MKKLDIDKEIEAEQKKLNNLKNKKAKEVNKIANSNMPRIILKQKDTIKHQRDKIKELKAEIADDENVISENDLDLARASRENNKLQSKLDNKSYDESPFN